jgi:hypothetical protein
MANLVHASGGVPGANAQTGTSGSTRGVAEPNQSERLSPANQRNLLDRALTSNTNNANFGASLRQPVRPLPTYAVSWRPRRSWHQAQSLLRREAGSPGRDPVMLHSAGEIPFETRQGLKKARDEEPSDSSKRFRKSPLRPSTRGEGTVGRATALQQHGAPIEGETVSPRAPVAPEGAALLSLQGNAQLPENEHKPLSENEGDILSDVLKDDEEIRALTALSDFVYLDGGSETTSSQSTVDSCEPPGSDAETGSPAHSPSDS